LIEDGPQNPDGDVIMNVKNLNPLGETCREDRTGRGSGGGDFIGYLAIQPITIPETDITAGAVEQR